MSSEISVSLGGFLGFTFEKSQVELIGVIAELTIMKWSTPRRTKSSIPKLSTIPPSPT